MSVGNVGSDLSKLKLSELGRVIGETSHTGIYFTAVRPPRVGEYVIIEYPGNEYVLGIVELSKIGNPLVSSSTTQVDTIAKAEVFGVSRHDYMIGYARLLANLSKLVREGKIEAPKYPPRPAAKVFEASDDILKAIFVKNRDDGWVRLGSLVNHPNVPFYVNVQALVSRHLAILAITGAGKSNAVAVLVRRIVDELSGTVLIVDMHSEYSNVASNVNTVRPKVNPADLTLSEYYRLLNLEPKASKQRLYLREAYSQIKSGAALREPEKFLDLLINEVKGYLESGKCKGRKIPSSDRNSIIDLLLKLQDLKDRYWGTVLSPEAPVKLASVIKVGYANIFQLGEVDEEVADVITSHYLRRLLDERKKHRAGSGGYPVPVLVVIEEAHILIPRNRSTLTKDVVARIAREGRKFGIGLCLVSQRPKNIDDNALSQTNNKIILKLVEPGDQRYVQSASETLSDELLSLLPSLNTGEAVVLGLMSPLPALVKIDEAKWKPSGRDLPVHKIWLNYKFEEGSEDFYDEIGI